MRGAATERIRPGATSEAIYAIRREHVNGRRIIPSTSVGKQSRDQAVSMLSLADKYKEGCGSYALRGIAVFARTTLRQNVSGFSTV